MSGMDQFLANYYGTNGASQSTETTIDKEAEASFELFAKVAAAEGIDLTKMSDEQVLELYTKVASEEPEKDDKEEEEKKEKEKEAAAKAELAAKTAAAAAAPVVATATSDAQEKIAEADYLGRIMAHAYVQEMKKIAEATPAETDKEASRSFSFGGFEKKKGLFEKLKGHGASAMEKIKEHGGKAHEKGKELAGKAKEHGSAAAAKIKEHAGKAKEHVGAHRGKYEAGGAAAAAGAGFAAGHKKEGSALDELAAERAMAKIAEANWDIEQGAQLLTELISKGASEENTKIAAAQGDLEGALEIRSLELLEQAGYQVNWAQ
jgi:hypothetical protein